MRSATATLIAVLLLILSQAGHAASGPEDSIAARKDFGEHLLLGQIQFLAVQKRYLEALELVADNAFLSESQLRERLKSRQQQLGDAWYSLADI